MTSIDKKVVIVTGASSGIGEATTRLLVERGAKVMLAARREEKLKKFEVTYDRHVAELGKIREAALKKGAFSAATNAEKNRGMAAGLYIDRKIIKTGKLEDLSEEELELKMKKILDDYAPILNAKQVDALPLEITEELKSKDKDKKA